MKVIRNIVAVSALILAICGFIYAYGKLNERVNNNIDNIRRNGQIIENQSIKIENELRLISSDCVIIKGDIREIKGYMKGKRNGN